MELADFFFPEQMEAAHLRSISRTLRRQRQSGERRASRATEAVADDLGFLALTLMALVGSLVEKGVLAEGDLRAHLQRLDGLDGVEDGRLDPDALRGALGLPRKPETEPEAPVPTPKPRRRRSR